MVVQAGLRIDLRRWQVAWLLVPDTSTFFRVGMRLHVLKKQCVLRDGLTLETRKIRGSVCYRESQEGGHSLAVSLRCEACLRTYCCFIFRVIVLVSPPPRRCDTSLLIVKADAG